MKKLVLRSMLAVIVAVFASSCGASHTGYMVNSASLSAANFSYVKQNVTGKATATYVFGIGGMAKETLVNTAKQKMLENYPLKSNQTLANITVNFKKSLYYFVAFGTVECTVTADIVEFNK